MFLAVRGGMARRLLGIFPENGPSAAPLLSHLGHDYSAMLVWWSGSPSRATILLASSVGKRTTIMRHFRRWMYLSLALLGLALSGTNAGAQPMAWPMVVIP